MPDTPPISLPRSQRLAPHGAFFALLALVALGVLALSTIGLAPTDRATDGMVAAVYALLTSGLVALAYLAGAVGYGWPIVACLVKPGPARVWLQLPVGVGAMLWLDHALGVMGVLSGRAGRVGAITITAVGIVLLAAQAGRYFKSSPRVPRVPWSALLGVVGVSVMLLAACSPPGWLWSSEAGGFDALSYHLPLAQEWATGPRLWPVHHNVYSYLPSYMEAGYTHIAAMFGGSLASGDGFGALACQMLHAMIGLLAGITTGRLAFVLARWFGAEERAAWLGGGLAAAVMISTPWTVVTGSLAYNEMPALLLGAGAMLATLRPASENSGLEKGTSFSPSPREGAGGGLSSAGTETKYRWSRALLVGLLAGTAGAAKPTVLFILGPTIGLLMLVTTPPRTWITVLVFGAIGGVIALGPPMARNYADTRNPIFPSAAKLFGTGHWTEEQAARFARAHGPEKPMVEQLGMLFATGGTSAVDEQPRGFMHAQWGVVPIAGVLAMGVLIARGPARKEASALLAGTVVGCVWWAGASHGQSRFLLPLLVPMSAALGTVAAAWLNRRGGVYAPARRIGFAMLCLVPLLNSARAVTAFLFEPDTFSGRPLKEAVHAPNMLLPRGTNFMTADLARDEYASRSREEQAKLNETMRASEFCNLNLPRTATDKLFLLGDATPFYYLTPVVYTTVWDRSVLASAMDDPNTEPEDWCRSLREAGCGYLLLNLSEYTRYTRTYGFDPAVTPANLQELTAYLGEPIRTWPSQRVLFRIPPVPPRPPATPLPRGAKP